MRIIFYLLLVVAIALIVIYFPKIFSNINNGVNENINTQVKKEPISNPELEAKYEKGVKDIISAFAQGEKPESARDALLDLTVPDTYKNIHLDLVFIFDTILQGANESDQAKIEDAMVKLGELEDKNTWMK